MCKYCQLGFAVIFHRADGDWIEKIHFSLLLQWWSNEKWWQTLILNVTLMEENSGANFLTYMEKAMALHSSTLAWQIPWAEEPGRLQSMESLGIGHDWETLLSLSAFMHWRRKWQPTEMATHSSVLAWRIPGTREPGGLLSLGSQSRIRLKRLSSSSSSSSSSNMCLYLIMTICITSKVSVMIFRSCMFVAYFSYSLESLTLAFTILFIYYYFILVTLVDFMQFIRRIFLTF